MNDSMDAWIVLALSLVLTALTFWLVRDPFQAAAEATLAPIALTPNVEQTSTFPARLEWQPVIDAHNYEVLVLDDQGGVAAHSYLTEPRWRLDRAVDVRRGSGRYHWEIRALRQGVLLGIGRGSFQVAASTR